MELISAHLDFGVDRNLHRKLADRICKGAAIPIRAVGPCMMLESLKDASRVLGLPNPSYKSSRHPYERGFCLNYSVKTVSPFIGL
jgi:hypothetical protein